MFSLKFNSTSIRSVYGSSVAINAEWLILAYKQDLILAHERYC